MNLNAVGTWADIQEYMTAEEIWLAALDDEHIGMLSNYVMCGWPSMKYKVQKKYSHTAHSEKRLWL